MNNDDPNCGPELRDDDGLIYIGGGDGWLLDLWMNVIFYGGLAILAYILFVTFGWL